MKKSNILTNFRMPTCLVFLIWLITGKEGLEVDILIRETVLPMRVIQMITLSLLDIWLRCWYEISYLIGRFPNDTNSLLFIWETPEMMMMMFHNDVRIFSMIKINHFNYELLFSDSHQGPKHIYINARNVNGEWKRFVI